MLNIVVKAKWDRAISNSTEGSIIMTQGQSCLLLLCSLVALVTGCAGRSGYLGKPLEDSIQATFTGDSATVGDIKTNIGSLCNLEFDSGETDANRSRAVGYTCPVRGRLALLLRTITDAYAGALLKTTPAKQAALDGVFLAQTQAAQAVTMTVTTGSNCVVKVCGGANDWYDKNYPWCKKCTPY